MWLVFLQKEMAAFSDMQYCKTDLIASKGIVYCKYSKSSSALRALETVQESSMVRPSSLNFCNSKPCVCYQSHQDCWNQKINSLSSLQNHKI